MIKIKNNKGFSIFPHFHFKNLSFSQFFVIKLKFGKLYDKIFIKKAGYNLYLKIIKKMLNQTKSYPLENSDFNNNSNNSNKNEITISQNIIDEITIKYNISSNSDGTKLFYDKKFSL